MIHRNDTRSVELPDDLVSRVEDRVPRSGFDSSDEYIAYVIEDLLDHLETETEATSEEPNEDLEERLSSLGYLNK